MAEWTGLEPATPCVTGRYSNQLNYHSASVFILAFECQLNVSGGRGEVRTPDIRLVRATLSQLSYTPANKCLFLD